MPPSPAPNSVEAFVQKLGDFFAPGGQLAQSKVGFEPRPGQLALAEAIARALLEQKSLLAEAGTGTGKTLAYLVPALLSRLKVVVSTATKQLQEQILEVDLPSIEKALGRRFDVVVMKGRQNYLCEARAEQATAQLALDPAQAKLVGELAAWRRQTQTGERSEFVALGDDNAAWRALSATREQCVGRSCTFYDRCWVVRMRRSAQEADLVVVNHHLFFADAALGQRGPDATPGAVTLLPPFEAVVFDEAHELDDIATQHFGHGVTDRQLIDLLDEVARLQENATSLPDFAPLLARTRREVEALFATLPQGGRILLQLADPAAHAERRRAHGRIDDALAYLEAELGDHADEPSKQVAKRVALAAQTLATVLGAAPRVGLLHGEGPPSAQPQASVAEVADGDAKNAAHGETAAGNDPVYELDGEPLAMGQEPQTQRADPYVRFGEVQAGHRQLAARPIDVAARMAQAFGETPCVFVSATLQVGGDFAHVKRRLGLGDVKTLAQLSSFDFSRQAHLYLPNDLPDPERDPGGSAAAVRAAELCRAAGGGAFVLCTSHRALVGMKTALERRFAGPVLVQGSAPKAHLLHQFARRTDAVLLATLGFWRGVDVPGPALRLVIMDRIPFAVPTDPLVAARVAALTEAGLDPFVHYQLPQAALLLRQGFGRLIRRQQDVGVVAILDRRLSSRRYGERLLEALPLCPRLVTLEQVCAILAAQQQAVDKKLQLP